MAARGRAFKLMFKVKSVSLGVKKELYESLLVSTVAYGVETLGMMKDERHKLGDLEIKCIRSTCRAIRIDRWRNGEVRCTGDVRQKPSDGVDW